MVSLHSLVGLVAGLTLVPSLATVVLADELTSLLPPDTNALIYLDVSAVASSPVATKGQWFDKKAEKGTDNPLMIPTGASKVVVGTELNAQQDVSYSVSVADIAQPLSIETIAANEGGHVEKVGDKPAVASPANAYFLALGDNRLATVYPANRQMATRVATGQYKGITSKYLQDAVSGAGAAPLVFAIDTDGMISAGDAFKALDERPIAALTDAKIDLRKYGQLLSTLKGIKLTVTFGDDVAGQALIQFGSDAALLKDAVKPVVLQTLSRRGMNIVDFSNWDFTVNGNEIRGQGKLTTFTLKRLLSLADAPVPNTDAPASKDEAPAVTAAAASQAYFKKITGILDGVKKAPSLGDQATWMRRDARRIGDMPILNVDPDLVAWGSDVAARLSATAASLMGGQQEMRATVGQIATPTPSTHDYTWNGDYYAESVNDAEYRRQLTNWRDQRRAAAGNQYAATLDEAFKTLDGLNASRSIIRQKMTAKYNVEF